MSSFFRYKFNRCFYMATMSQDLSPLSVYTKRPHFVTVMPDELFPDWVLVTASNSSWILKSVVNTSATKVQHSLSLRHEILRDSMTMCLYDIGKYEYDTGLTKFNTIIGTIQKRTGVSQKSHCMTSCSMCSGSYPGKWTQVWNKSGINSKEKNPDV